MDPQRDDQGTSLSGPPGASGGDRARSLIAVGIGASAGGLEAFTELIRQLPPDTGMAFILVQHLDPHHESSLPELLAAKTPIPVLQVRNGAPIEPGHIYIIPPNALMLVRGRNLVLEPRPAPHERFDPIDTFLESLAREFRSNAVGVVLSGTASDGTLGLKKIRTEGGITFAQDQTARFDGMPRSAIAAGVVDFVLPPSQIAEELAAIALRKAQLDNTKGAPGDKTFERLLLLLRSGAGLDFAQYSEAAVLRRVNRRMLMGNLESTNQYLKLLRKDPGELRELSRDLLSSAAEFFRDPAMYESLKGAAFPSIVRERGVGPIRLWVPGCSSGEEVYSLVAALVEFLESENLESGIQAFGTDLSESAISKARAAVYDESETRDISPERLRRFFVRKDSSYQVRSSIRDVCVFSRHNLAKDPPLSRMDVISCPSLLAEFVPSLQRHIISRFRTSLRRNGCLLLGPSGESSGLADFFAAVDEPHRIYARRDNVTQAALCSVRKDRESERAPSKRSGGQSPDSGDGDIDHYGNQVVLKQYRPAGLVVNDRLKIVEYRGDPGPYLTESENRLGAGLMNKVRAELRAGIGSAIEQARITKIAAVAGCSPGAAAGKTAITVVPLALAGVVRHFLILFGRTAEMPGAAAAPAATAPEGENEQLRRELETTREYLQSVIEELRSTNEEARSGNEELQSMNEELQASQAELQAANEELQAMNLEVQSRNSELARLNDDLTNLFSSMSMPVLMTGSDLRIRRFTPMAERVLRLAPADIGRPITDLKLPIDVPDLEQILLDVLNTVQPHEQEVRDREGREYLMRVRPYRTGDNRIDGTILQLYDVSELKRSMEEVKRARDYAENIVNTVREPLVVLDENLTIQNANRAFHDALGLAPGEATGWTIYEAARGALSMPEVRRLLEEVDGSAEGSVEVESRREGSEPRILSLNVRRLQTPARQKLILLAFEDVTERKRAAEARYRRLFESARDGILLVDASSGEIVDLNPFTERLLGYSRDELVGRRFWETRPLQEVPRMRTAFQEIREGGVLRFDDLALRNKSGNDIQTEVIANLYSEWNRPVIQFNIRDVSERKKFERELQETQKLESLGLLAGGIAHDFNNLLTGVIGNASLAHSELPPDHPLQMHLRDIVRAGERAAFLTRQMLAYAGKGRFVSEQIDLGEMIREISSLIRTSIPKSVELDLRLAPNLPPIEADPAQIQQVVMNLVINGAEAIAEDSNGKVEIQTSLRKLSSREAAESFSPEQFSPGTYVQVVIRDTGSGMDEATKARIFDPFFTTKFTGRGLGLSAVRGIIKSHGGAIRVHSSPGAGTSFTILLPSRHAKVAAPPAEKARAASIPSGVVALIIDDEDAIRGFAATVLTRAGAKVLMAGDGKSGAEMLRQNRGAVSVVLLDLLMPVMGGEKTIPLLKEIDPAVPVILSSGFEESEAARKFSDVKPSRFLQKPYTSDQLVEAVAAALPRHRRAGGNS